MYQLEEYLQERIKKLKQILREKENEMSCAPEGVLQVSQSRKRTQYYYKKNSSDLVRRYMRKEEHDLIRRLCQKEYDQRVLSQVESELQMLERLLKCYPEIAFERIYEKLNFQRKELVVPVIATDAQYVMEWESETYTAKSMSSDMPEYYTNRDERVRSKTEILIANALDKYGIPYKYERPLRFAGGECVHPDFTVLNVKLRKEYYWEHMGMMDDPVYAEHALSRIDLYQNNGIFPGEGLILTHETAKHPINPRNIDRMIKRYLI